MIVISGTALSASPSRGGLKSDRACKKNNTVVVFDIDYRPHTWKSRDEISIYYTFAARGTDIIMGSKEEFELTDALLYEQSTDRETADRWLVKMPK